MNALTISHLATIRTLLLIALALPVMAIAQKFEEINFSDGTQDVTLHFRIGDEMWFIDRMDVGTSITIDDEGSRFVIAPIEGWYRISAACGDYTGQSTCKLTLTAIWAAPPFVLAEGTVVDIHCPKGTNIVGRRPIP